MDQQAQIKADSRREVRPVASQPTRPLVLLLQAVLATFCGFVLQCALMSCFYQKNPPLKIFLIGSFLTVTIAVSFAAMEHFFTQGRALKGTAILLSAALFSLVVLSEMILRKQILSYADGWWMILNIVKGVVHPRSIQSTAILAWLYDKLHALFLVQRELTAAGIPTSETIQNASIFFKVLGAAVMAATMAGLCIQKSRSILPLAFSATTGVWAILATGFLKYYPFVATVFLAGLVWLRAKPLSERNPMAVGLLLAIWVTAYIGIIPFVAIVVLCLIVRNPRHGIACAAWGAFGAYLLVQIFWPNSFINYITQLIGSTNLPILHVPYKGHEIGPNSINFAWSFIWTAQHWRDKFFILTFSGTIMAALVFCGAIFAVWISRNKNSVSTKSSPGGGAVEAALLLMILFEAMHMLRAIPMLGPHDDILLFWPLGLLFGFAAGVVLDRYEDRLSSALPRLLFCCQLGAVTPLIYAVAFYGIPQ